jgi:hypothetical protein
VGFHPSSFRGRQSTRLSPGVSTQPPANLSDQVARDPSRDARPLKLKPYVRPALTDTPADGFSVHDIQPPPPHPTRPEVTSAKVALEPLTLVEDLHQHAELEQLRPQRDPSGAVSHGICHQLANQQPRRGQRAIREHPREPLRQQPPRNARSTHTRTQLTLKRLASHEQHFITTVYPCEPPNTQLANLRPTARNALAGASEGSTRGQTKRRDPAADPGRDDHPQATCYPRRASEARVTPPTNNATPELRREARARATAYSESAGFARPRCNQRSRTAWPASTHQRPTNAAVVPKRHRCCYTEPRLYEVVSCEDVYEWDEGND